MKKRQSVFQQNEFNETVVVDIVIVEKANDVHILDYRGQELVRDRRVGFIIHKPK